LKKLLRRKNKTGKYEDAVKSYGKVLEINPNYPEVQKKKEESLKKVKSEK